MASRRSVFYAPGPGIPDAGAEAPGKTALRGVTQVFEGKGVRVKGISSQRYLAIIGMHIGAPSHEVSEQA